jgi:predicted AlkP superfamily phosphohydrolase/phosphomutase/Flp pilus assembly protein TadD
LKKRGLFFMSNPSAKRVLLLGWDAADWVFLTPLLDGGKMPNLQRLIDGGTSGRIATLQPILSPILWNSIATGKRGDKHGVLSFVEPMPDGQGIRPVSSYSRRAKALWNILSQLGLRSVVVNWFASHPAEPINGAIVSNRFSQSVLSSPTTEESAFYPADLADTMAKLRVTAAQLTPAQMAPFFQEKPPEDDDWRLQKLAHHVAQCASVHNAATYLAEAEDWDLLAVYYDMIDHVGHDFAQYGPPKMEHVSEDDFQTYSHVMENTYRYHDLMLGRWLDLIDDETAVIILSDHGFYHGAGRPLAERAHLSGERPKGVHANPLIWHRLHGIFVARGPGIKADSLVHGASLLDVAPTILSLLGQPVPEDFEGKVLTTIFESDVHVQTSPSLEAPHPEDGVHRGAPIEEKDPWAAQQAIAQLAELGYVETPGADTAKQVASAIEAHDSHLAQIYFSTQRFAESLELLASLTKQNSGDPSYPARQAMCLIGLGRIEEAGVIVQEILCRNPYYGLAKMLSGQIAFLRGKPAEAEAIFEELRQAETEMPALHNQLGIICIQQRRWKEAADFFRRALEADPDLPEAHDGLGVALRHLGDTEEAINQHMLAVSLQHDRPQSHINLGLSLARARQIDWAIRAFSIAAELAPAEPYPHRCLARIYRKIRPDYEKARHHLLHARELRRRLGATTPAFRQGV